MKTLRATGGLVPVGLELPSGDLLHARITRAIAQLLQLKRAVYVLALCPCMEAR